MNASSIAIGERSVLIAGTPTLVWPAGATRTTPPDAGRAALGVVRDHGGHASVVPIPQGHADAAHARVAPAGASAWHVMFVTGRQGTPTNALAFDSADVWYGLFDGRSWRDVRRVATARSASLLPGTSSELLTTGDGLAFAYAFDRPTAVGSAGRDVSGVVLLHRRGDRWLTDTLLTWEGPRAVQLTTLPAGGILAILAQDYFAGGRPRGPALFTARHRGSWSEPALALDPAPRYVTAPMAVPGRATSITSWRTAAPGLETDTLEWGFVDSSGTLRRAGPLTPVLPIDRPAMIRLDSARVAWFARNGSERDEVRTIVGLPGGTTADLGVARMPLENFTIVGAALPNGKILLVTGGRGTSDDAPPANTYLTELAVSCSARGR